MAPNVTKADDALTTRAALTRAVARTAQLLRSGLDPTALAPGLSWSAAEVAAHLVADLREHTALAAGNARSAPAANIRDDRRSAAERGAAANRAQLEAFCERDLTVLADLLEAAAADLDAAIENVPPGQPILTANGVAMTPSTLVSICLGEQLIHGLDLARSSARQWNIEPADALRVIPGMMAIASEYLDRSAAERVHVSYELRFSPDQRYRFVVDGPTATVATGDSGARQRDCIITADPVAFLLVAYGRVGQWSQILRGKLRAGGRRPWMALRFSSLLIRP